MAWHEAQSTQGSNLTANLACAGEEDSLILAAARAERWAGWGGAMSVNHLYDLVPHIANRPSCSCAKKVQNVHL